MEILETKEERRARRLKERRERRGPTKEELLKQEGRRFINFVVPIAPFELWVQGLQLIGKTPNERIWELIVKDLKGEIYHGAHSHNKTRVSAIGSAKIEGKE